MRLMKGIGLVSLSGFVLSLGLVAGTLTGCDSGTNVQLAPAPPVQAGESKPIPKDAKKGGGKGSSGNMNKNPGGNT